MPGAMILRALGVSPNVALISAVKAWCGRFLWYESRLFGAIDHERFAWPSDSSFRPSG